MTLWHGLYLLWLLAGTCDFILHRRSAIDVTSGLRESSLHLVQIGLLGTGTLLWLLFPPTPALWFVLLAIVCIHALAGYWDTRVAFPVRTIIPLEQHVHSILDIAPWVALGVLGWPLLSAAPAPLDDSVGLRLGAAAASTWLFALIPALLLTVLPALLEFRRCWRSRHKAR